MHPKFTAKIISPDGTITPVKPANGTAFTLMELRQHIGGGYIEVIRPPSHTGAVIVCDEEGKLKKQPLNLTATRMWQEHAEPGSARTFDYVVGTVLLCHRSQID